MNSLGKGLEFKFCPLTFKNLRKEFSRLKFEQKVILSITAGDIYMFKSPLADIPEIIDK